MPTLNFHLIITLIALPIFWLGCLVYARRKAVVSLGMVGLGALGFYVSVNILESLLHLLVLRPAPDGHIALLQQHPLGYVAYGILAAGIFEETARLAALRLVQKKRALATNDGLAYGLGHGGMELLLACASVAAMVYAMATSSAALAKIPPFLLAQIQSLATASPYWIALERLIALGVQILLSYWVWYAVARRRLRYYCCAVALHALVDLPVALWQAGMLGRAELYALLAAGLIALAALSWRCLRTATK